MLTVAPPLSADAVLLLTRRMSAVPLSGAPTPPSIVMLPPAPVRAPFGSAPAVVTSVSLYSPPIASACRRYSESAAPAALPNSTTASPDDAVAFSVMLPAALAVAALVSAESPALVLTFESEMVCPLMVTLPAGAGRAAERIAAGADHADEVAGRGAADRDTAGVSP